MPSASCPFSFLKKLDALGNPDDANVARPERVVSLAAGAALAVYGISQRSATGAVLALLGGAFVFRGLSGQCLLYRELGIDTAHPHTHAGVPGNQGINVERSITVDRAPTQVYHYWRKLGNLPNFMPHLASVEEKNSQLSHWKVKGPAGLRIEWDAEIIIDRIGEMISWQSVPGSLVENAGSVWFRPSRNGRGTDVKVSLQYLPPAGALGNAVARLFGGSPDQQIVADLTRFKELLESDSDAAA